MKRGVYNKTETKYKITEYWNNVAMKLRNTTQEFFHISTVLLKSKQVKFLTEWMLIYVKKKYKKMHQTVPKCNMNIQIKTGLLQPFPGQTKTLFKHLRSSRCLRLNRS